MMIFPVFDKSVTHLLRDQLTDRQTYLSKKQVVMAVNDASSSDFFNALTLIGPNMSIFIIFHESVTDGRTDGRTDRPG